MHSTQHNVQPPLVQHVIVGLVLCCFFVLFSAPYSSAASPTISADVRQTNAEITISEDIVIVTGRVSAGFLNGQANELVYWPSGSSTKISQLIWSFNNVLMIGGGITIQPARWLKFNGDVFLNGSGGSNDLVDYDWRYTTTAWSDRSNHDDVELTSGIMFDINAEFIFFQKEKSSLSAILGYKQDSWEWEARGGEFIYSIGGFRNSIGTFSDGLLGVTYEQTFQTPYVGLGFQFDLDPMVLDGRFCFSAFSSASDTDHHHLRNLVYEREFDPATMIYFNFGATYKFTKHFALAGRFQLTKYFTTRGDTTVTRETTGQKTTHNDIAGIDNDTSMFMLSLLFMF